MKTELHYLVYVTALTGLLWVPYILERIGSWGLAGAVGYPEHPPAQAPWAMTPSNTGRSASSVLKPR